MPLPFGLPLGRARLRSSRAQNAAVPLRIRSRKLIHFRALELPGSECFGSLEDSIKKVNLFELRSPQAQNASVSFRVLLRDRRRRNPRREVALLRAPGQWQTPCQWQTSGEPTVANCPAAALVQTAQWQTPREWSGTKK